MSINLFQLDHQISRLIIILVSHWTNFRFQYRIPTAHVMTGTKWLSGKAFHLSKHSEVPVFNQTTRRSTHKPELRFLDSFSLNKKQNFSTKYDCHVQVSNMNLVKSHVVWHFYLDNKWEKKSSLVPQKEGLLPMSPVVWAPLQCLETALCGLACVFTGPVWRQPFQRGKTRAR